MAIAAPGLLASVMGLWGLRRQGSLWQDELVTVDMAHRSWTGLWLTLHNVDAVHGAYYALMKLLFGLWDGGLVMLRLPSVVAATIATVGVTMLGRKLVDQRVGVWAGYIFCLLPMVQRYSQEGRSYALVAACVVWGTFFLVRLAEGSSFAVLWYGGLMTAACTLHEFAVLAVLSHVISVALMPRWRRMVVLWSRAVAILLVVVVPLAYVSIGQKAQVEWISLTSSAVVGYLLVSAVGVTGFIRFSRAVGQPRNLLGIVLLPMTLVPGGVLLIVSVVKPLYVDRYVLFAMAGVSVLAAAGLGGLTSVKNWRVPVAVIIGIGVVFSLITANHLRTPGSRSDDVAAVSAAVAKAGRRGDGVVFLPSSRRIWVQTPDLRSAGLSDVALERSPRDSNSLYGTERSPETVMYRISRLDRLVVISEPGRRRIEWSPQDDAKQGALNNYTACRTRTVGKAVVAVYVRSGRGGC